MSTSVHRPPVPVTALDLLDRSRASLLTARQTGDAGQRYIQAHLGALRAAAALLAARSVPSGPARPRSVWQLLPAMAPELIEWATFFAASAAARAAIERGRPPAPRDADDLVRQAEIFLELIRRLLGVPSEPLPDYITPVARRVGHVARDQT